MREKACFKCEESQPIVNFYRHPMMGDGYLGKCKACTRHDVRQNYAAKREYYRQYDRDRYAGDKERRTPQQRTGLKRKAEVAVHNAVARGKLKKLACEVCGEPKSEAHHHDYTKPLDVMWLCRKHHKILHRL